MCFLLNSRHLAVGIINTVKVLWTCAAAFVSKFSTVRLKISSWVYHQEPFSATQQTKSSHAEPFAVSYFSLFLFSKTLVLQTLMHANAMTAALTSWLSLFFLSFPLNPFSVCRRRSANHMVRLVRSQKIMGSYCVL